MITEQALAEAIAECQGQRNPNRDTCMMLAAFYTIQDHLYGRPPEYSYAPPPETNLRHSGADLVGDYGESDFLQAIRGKDPGEIWRLMDELMDTLKVINERVYNGVMRKIR